jgi:Flp pilus assembly protein TadB
VLLLGAPVLVALLTERRLETEAAARGAIVSLELPVVAEQLGILLGSGLSLGAALDRIARRSDGLVATELADVVREVRRGRTETEALRDWARLADSQCVDRLVSVLSLHRDASDLGALISTEARAIRDASHRALVESIEKRAQLVWVPVTVATLVPGLILIGVPFVRAMSAVAG